MNWLVALAVTAAAAGPVLNPRVTQANIHQTICVPGWSRAARPSESYTQHIKFVKLLAVGAPISHARLFELDHLVPIELGGAPYDSDNMWLQPWPEAHKKDLVENRLHDDVCAGRIPLSTAQQCMWADWTKCP